MEASMKAWTGAIDGALGAFFWVAPGAPGEFLGPIIPMLFDQFRDNAHDRAILMARDPSSTFLAWVSVEVVEDDLDEPRAYVLGRLPEISDWCQCALWAEAASERATLARCLAPAEAKERLRL